MAHALEKLPLIAAAMARGEVSYSKVRAITRVASAATEDYFLYVALHGTVAIHVLDDGAVRFVKPDGEAFEGLAELQARPPADWTQLVVAHRAAGLRIDRQTATSRWRGETMDYGMAIDILFGRERRPVCLGNARTSYGQGPVGPDPL